MKRSGFRQQSLEEIQEKQAIKREKDRLKTPSRKPKTALQRTKPSKSIKATKTINKGYKPPKWFSSLKQGSHGNTPAQKKYWKVVSDTIRKEEFEKYNGKCITCPKILDTWQDGQCAHYKPWSVCHGFFKYERKNLALSCANCNRLSGGEVGYRYSQELKRRYGEDILDWIESENQTHRGEKMEVWVIVERTEALLQTF